MKTIIRFIINGGLLGNMRGFDAEVEGHWYGFEELSQDLSKLLESLQTVRRLT